jgi:8-hydroxy-5-deazaflavin:NADPH oxidoreductase
MTTIAVMGSGRIGGTLAAKWAEAGHAVIFGARDPDKADLVDRANRIGAEVAPIAEAADRGEVVLFAIPGSAMEGTLAGLGTAIDGKIVIDATNNVGGDTMNSRHPIEVASPGASYFRAFNTLGWEQFERPVLGGVQADLFFCGPDGEARDAVEGLIADVGLRPVWVGGPDEVSVVDGLLALWFTLVMKRGLGRRLAFKMIQE